jgi:hypothetical protein
MARQRKPQSHDEELPFVALMDTMTNVVGVLVIVLVMIGISLASSVRKVLSELPPVTVEQLQEILKKVVDATPKEDPKKLADEKKKLEEQIKKAAEELKTLDLSSEKQNIKVMDLDEIRKKLDEGKKRRDAKKAQTDELLAQLDKLKALLDTTPVYTPPPPSVVRMPNPRAMPEQAVQHLMLVAGNRVHYLTEQEFLKLAVEDLHKAEKTLLHPSSTADKPVFDHQKSADHLTSRPVKNRHLKLSPEIVATISRLRVKIEPTPEGGETVEQMKNPASNYQRLLRKLKEDPKNVVAYLVFKDSVETYIAAREVADAIGMPATWKMINTPFFVADLPGIVVNPLKANPVAPPTAPALTIPPPKANID